MNYVYNLTCGQLLVEGCQVISSDEWLIYYAEFVTVGGES